MGGGGWGRHAAALASGVCRQVARCRYVPTGYVPGQCNAGTPVAARKSSHTARKRAQSAGVDYPHDVAILFLQRALLWSIPTFPPLSPPEQVLGVRGSRRETRACEDTPARTRTHPHVCAHAFRWCCAPPREGAGNGLFVVGAALPWGFFHVFTGSRGR